MLYIISKSINKTISKVVIKCFTCRVDHRLILLRFLSESLTEVAKCMIKEKAPQESERSRCRIDYRYTISKLNRCLGTQSVNCRFNSRVS